MFVKINKRVDKHGEMTYTASIMRSDRVKGKVVQGTVCAARRSLFVRFCRTFCRPRRPRRPS